MGDISCDNAIEALTQESSSTGKDLLETLQEHVKNRSDSNAATDFLVEISQVPPTGIRVNTKDVLLARTFFLDYSVQIMQALLHYSLAGGFASPRIVKTLRAVSYLMTPERQGSDIEQESKAADDRTFSRLLETMQFFLDVMGCTVVSANAERDVNEHMPDLYLLPGGDGWKASSFSTVPIWTLKRLHLHPDPEQVRAYLGVWRHIGFYLGVSPEILARYLSSPDAADKFLASVTLDLFSSGSPLDPRTIPTLPILRAVSHRPPRASSLAHNCALTRHLVGDALADYLGLPRTPLHIYVKLRWSLLVQSVPVLFGRWYPRRGWAEKRREVMREGLSRSVRWSLGMRRATFRPRTDVRVPAEAGSEDIGGELADGVREIEAVQPDFAGGRVLLRKWREVVYEMVAVCAGASLVLVAIAWQVVVTT
ncbi:uncharacterized protein PHACADRAFT_92488 [Phanerochaete carnosa HHB-10118-sp]|uniref:ER-bound oxygenase mpaB/mpaB'/Rubber oxygenase catalytic domain-containing protein n=1 Tax=Phanerochaete carnosa (strain HHB-10118-sp) TaxID=650164 RepID=K5WB10_PHACS|nr:uncharacterized protein PHACADRAFT_92488 [Phanerochaete carnosa HHB-10118-sp]EKM56380.1 hypothetical protein PHACADRAFT_92488 [Phanerochaete carnosa HHB-10118-sp]